MMLISVELLMMFADPALRSGATMAGPLLYRFPLIGESLGGGRAA